jgi:hypothetical protein
VVAESRLLCIIVFRDGGGRPVNAKELISHSQFTFSETPIAYTYNLVSRDSRFADGSPQITTAFHAIAALLEGPKGN